MKIGGSEGHASLGSMSEIKAWFTGSGLPGGTRPPMGQDPGPRFPNLQALPDERVTPGYVRGEQDAYGAALHRYGGRAHRRGNGRATDLRRSRGTRLGGWAR